MSTCWFQKLYAVCDLALGLVLTKTTSFVLKESKAEPLLPSKLFTKPDKVGHYWQFLWHHYLHWTGAICPGHTPVTVYLRQSYYFLSVSMTDKSNLLLVLNSSGVQSEMPMVSFLGDNMRSWSSCIYLSIKPVGFLLTTVKPAGRKPWSSVCWIHMVNVILIYWGFFILFFTLLWKHDMQTYYSDSYCRILTIQIHTCQRNFSLMRPKYR